jgi:hypothetical protein
MMTSEQKQNALSGAREALAWGIAAAAFAAISYATRGQGLVKGRLSFPLELALYLIVGPLVGLIAGILAHRVVSPKHAAIVGMIAGIPFSAFVTAVYQAPPDVPVDHPILLRTAGFLLGLGVAALGGVGYFIGTRFSARRHGA